MASIRSYIDAITIEVNNGDFYMEEENVIYAVPVECIALERGGENPFGEWSQSSDAYWAYVLVQYDAATYKHTYGFTFKDSAGYTMYPLIANKMSEDGSEVDVNLDVSRPKTGLYTYLASTEVWEDSGFKFNKDVSTGENATRLKVYNATDEEDNDSEYKCQIYRRGTNYEELKLKINTDFALLKANDPLYKQTDESLDRCYSNYDICYGDNGGNLETDAYGGIVLDNNNPVVLINNEQVMEKIKSKEEISVNLTVKAATNQEPAAQRAVGTKHPGDYAATMVAVANQGSGNYIIWIGFYKNYLHVYSYVQGSQQNAAREDGTTKGFASVELASGTNGDTEKMYNIQVTAKRSGDVHIYVNGLPVKNPAKSEKKVSVEELVKFPAGTKAMDGLAAKQTTIGDLRPYRNLKFKGTIYEIEIYNRIISEDEITQNFNRAKRVWADLW